MEKTGSSSTAGLGPPAETQVYRLYVRAASPVSSRAVVNSRRFLDSFLPDAHQLAVLDIADHVGSAQADQVVACPTLIRLLPLPQRRFIGDMSDTTRLQASLGLKTPKAT